MQKQVNRDKWTQTKLPDLRSNTNGVEKAMAPRCSSEPRRRNKFGCVPKAETMGRMSGPSHPPHLNGNVVTCQHWDISCGMHWPPDWHHAYTYIYIYIYITSVYLIHSHHNCMHSDIYIFRQTCDSTAKCVLFRLFLARLSANKTKHKKEVHSIVHARATHSPHSAPATARTRSAA